MKDFISVDVESALSNDDVFSIFSGDAPNFRGRREDSDVRGTYASGLAACGVKE